MPTFILDEPLPLLLAPLRTALAGQSCEVADWPVIDSTPDLHDEAAMLDADELADAARALLEDGIFDRADWPAAYHSSADADAILRAGVKYGWALAHLAAMEPREAVEWSVADGSVATTATEHAFLVAEIRRRGLPVRGLALCIPGQLEPGIDYGGDVERFASWRAGLSASATPPLFFTHAADKFSLLPFLRGDTLRISQLAWMEALRVVTRCATALFRELLVSAQEHFVFDKVRAVQSTSEEDIRALPLVDDTELEAVFLNDPRGRQLLHVTATSLAADHRERLTGFTGEAALLEALVAAQVERHLGQLRE